MWKVLNSNFALLILGFVLTTLVGTYLADRVQRDAFRDQLELEENKQFLEWRREKKFELLRQRLAEGSQSIEEISDLINTRVFHIENVIASIFSNNPESMAAHWQKSLEASQTWNIKLNRFQNRLNRVVSPQAANAFNGYTTDPYPSLEISAFEQLTPDGQFEINPVDVHAHFWIIHKLIQDTIPCVNTPGCTVTKPRKTALQTRLINLNFFTDEFVDTTANQLVENTLSLEEFEDFR